MPDGRRVSWENDSPAAQPPTPNARASIEKSLLSVGRCALNVGPLEAAMVATAENKLETIRNAFPKEGLFAQKDWLISPEPFSIDHKLARDLEQLGHRLFVFQRACNQLYQLSAKGKQPAWIAKYLDAG